MVAEAVPFRTLSTASVRHCPRSQTSPWRYLEDGSAARRIYRTARERGKLDYPFSEFSMRPFAMARAPLWLVAAAVASAPLSAQQRTPQNRIALEQYLDWEDVQAPQFSPSGSRSHTLGDGSTRSTTNGSRRSGSATRTELAPDSSCRAP